MSLRYVPTVCTITTAFSDNSQRRVFSHDRCCAETCLAGDWQLAVSGLYVVVMIGDTRTIATSSAAGFPSSGVGRASLVPHQKGQFSSAWRGGIPADAGHIACPVDGHGTVTATVTGL
jgi:hypothetical protein